MRRPMWATAALAALAIAVSSCGISLQALPKIGGVSGPTYTIKATFANVVNLPANAEVRVGAFSVGYVSAIGVHDFQAVVTMKIKKSTTLPKGTTAAIHFDTPLGEDFVLLQPPAGSVGRGPVLADGTQIPESSTQTAPSVEDAFGALGALLNGGGINQLQTIIDQTNLALDGNKGQIHQLLSELSTTLTAFATNTPSIDNALRAIAALSQTLNQSKGTIANGIAAIGPALNVIRGENGNFDTLISQLGRLSTAANSIVEASTAGSIESVQALKPLLDQLVSVQVQQQLPATLAALDAVERATPGAIPGDYVQLAINATVQVPPVPSDALPLHKVTVDPPESTESYDQSGIATIIEGGLP